jgi:hypothetical protein
MAATKEQRAVIARLNAPPTPRQLEQQKKAKEKKGFTETFVTTARPAPTKTTIFVDSSGKQKGAIIERGKTEADIIRGGGATARTETVRGTEAYVQQQLPPSVRAPPKPTFFSFYKNPRDNRQSVFNQPSRFGKTNMPPSAFRSIRQDKTGFFNIRNQPKSYYQDAGDNKKTGWASERIKPKYEKLLIATEEDRLRAKKVREGWVNAMDKGVIKLFDAAPRKYIIKGQIPRRDAEVIAQYSKDQDFPIMASTFVNAMNPASLIYSAEDTARKMISYTYGRLNLKNLSKEDKKDVIKDWKQNKADALKSAKQSIPDFFKRNKELVKEIIKTQDPKATGELLATVAMIALARSGMAKDITKIKAQLKSSGQSTNFGNIIKAKWNQPKVTKIEKKAAKIYDAITEKGGGIKITPDLIRRQLTEANIRLVKNINVNTGGKSVRYNIGQKIKIDLTKPRGSFKINGKYKDGTISGFITQQGIQVTRLKGKKFEVVTTTMPSGKFKQIIYSKGKQINKRIGINKEGYFLDMSNPFTVLNRVNNLGSKYDQLIKDTKLIKSYQGETIRGNRKYKFDLQTTKKMDISVQSTRKAYYAEIGKILDLKERGVAVKVWKDKLNNLNTRIKLSNKEKMLVPDILKHSSKYLNIKRQAKLMADVKIKLDNILTIRSEKIRVNRLKNLLDKLKAKGKLKENIPIKLKKKMQRDYILKHLNTDIPMQPWNLQNKRFIKKYRSMKETEQILKDIYTKETTIKGAIQKFKRVAIRDLLARRWTKENANYFVNNKIYNIKNKIRDFKEKRLTDKQTKLKIRQEIAKSYIDLLERAFNKAHDLSKIRDLKKEGARSVITEKNPPFVFLGKKLIKSKSGITEIPISKLTQEQILNYHITPKMLKLNNKVRISNADLNNPSAKILKYPVPLKKSFQEMNRLDYLLNKYREASNKEAKSLKRSIVDRFSGFDVGTTKGLSSLLEKYRVAKENTVKLKEQIKSKYDGFDIGTPLGLQKALNKYKNPQGQKVTLLAKDRFTGLEVGTQRKLSNALNKWRKSGKKGQGQFLLSSLVDRLDSVLIKPSELTGKQISDLRIPETTIKQDIFIRVPPSVLQYKQLSKIYLGTKAETAGGKIRPPFFGIPQTHPSLGMKAITSPILEQEADTKQDTKTQTVQELEQEQQLDQDIVQQLKSQTIQDLSDTQIQALSQELAPVPDLDPIVDVTPLPDDPTPPQLVEFLLDLPQNPPKNKRLPFWIELPPSLLKKIKKLKKKKKYKFLFKYAPTLAGVGQKGTEKSFYSGFELRGSRLYYKKPILVHQHKRGNLKYKMFVRKHQRAKSRFKGFSKR